MAKLSRKKGTTSYIAHIFIQDSSSTTGAGLTGLTNASSGLVCRYVNPGGTLSASITLETIATLGTYAAPTSAAHIRFKEVSNADPSKGVYEIQTHNDWMNLTGGSILIMLAGATNMAQALFEIELTGPDNQDAVRGGMTALPNAAADAAGGLPISDAGGLDMDAIALDVAGLDGAAMRGTDGAYTGTPPTVAAIADAVLDETPTGHTGALKDTYDNAIQIGVAGVGLTAVLTNQITESYAANGVAPTYAQAIMAMHQLLMQFVISGTSYTVKKLDNTTTAFVGTLNDGTAPTSLVRT